MQAPVQLYYYQCFPRPPPPPSQPEHGLAMHGTTHNGLPGLSLLPIHSQQPKSAIPVDRVIVSARSWLARCQEGLQVAAGIQQYAPLLRVQGWTLLIADCGKRGEADKAREVFRAVPQKNVWHHSAFIGALGACGQWKEALAALQHLKQLGYADRLLQPNHVTYSAAIAACARVHRLDIALQLFQEMQAAGLTPDSITYAIVLQTASRMGAWQPVEQLLQAMHSRGMPARMPVYSAYLRQLCRAGQWNRALSLFLVMQDLGVPATPLMVLDLGQALTRGGRPHMAALLLKEAEQAGLNAALCAHGGTLNCLQPNGRGQQQHAGRQHTTRQDYCWPPPPALPQQQASPQHLAAAAGGVAAAGAAAAVAVADACGGKGGAGAAADTVDACNSSSSSSSRQDSFLQHLVACFEQCPFFVDDADAPAPQSDAGTEEYPASFASSSELSVSEAAAGFAASVPDGMPMMEGPCCQSTCASSALPSPLPSPTAKPLLAAARTPPAAAAARSSAAAVTSSMS
ncbi:hypothetical protein COO60DRAFT_1120221 [Scenedesmus sp. NREL 46B-D3]|nr:hypothetical protein COO60DRAFT_1120221 [Scenedesmus sp. NREL 46B-D3]